MFIELQVEEAGQWWSLARRHCPEADAPKVTAELKVMLWQWQSIRYFDGGTRMRVETTTDADWYQQRSAPRAVEVGQPDYLGRVIGLNRKRQAPRQDRDLAADAEVGEQADAALAAF
jgi:hypothetical protein